MIDWWLMMIISSEPEIKIHRSVKKLKLKLLKILGCMFPDPLPLPELEPEIYLFSLA